MPSEDYPLSSDEEPEFRGPPSSGNVHFLPSRCDEMLEINVESLVGTTFELRLSSHTTVSRIKSRLHSSEGIPKQHLHLLYKGKELSDDLRLCDCGVENGSTLKLVLSMRVGPINTRRVPVPPAKQQQHSHADLHNLMMRNKAQIIDKIPKNGQVTVLLFRDGDKLNLYHVQEKQDGTFSPLSPSASSLGNDPSWSGRSSSLRNLLNKDSRSNPDLDQRLKENAATMNKMMELRTQLENLSMTKRKRRQKSKPKRAESSSTTTGTRPRSYKSRPVASSPLNSNRTRVGLEKFNSDSNRKGTYPVRGLGNSLTGSIPLPPINPSNQSLEDQINERMRNNSLMEDEFCTILPLQPKTGGGRMSRTSSLSSTLPSMAGFDPTDNSSQRYGKSKPTKRQKTIESRISEESASSRVPQWLERNELHQQIHSFDNRKLSTDDPEVEEDEGPDDDYYVADGDFDFEDPNEFCSNDNSPTRRNIDLIDLQFRPNEEESLRILKCRRTQKLISADIRTLVQGGSSPVKGQPKIWKTPSDNSPGTRFRNVRSSASESSPRMLKSTPTATLRHEDSFISEAMAFKSPQAPRTSSSRKSSSKKRQNISSGHSRNSGSGRSRVTSAKRPTFTANPLTSTTPRSSAKKKKKSSSNKPRCSFIDCKKKLTITNTFTCRCSLDFCPNHRHPEWHKCTFDYKTEGRKLLEKANPIVALPKLPKI